MAKRLAVVGATGPTGVHVVDIALSRGHEVVAYVRRPEALAARPGLTIVGGQLDDLATFAEALRGCDVVICTLGNRSFRVRNFMEVHLPFVTNAMLSAGVPRIALMSALGGGEVPKKSRGLNRLVFKFLSNVVFVDRTKSEAALQSTGLAWSAVYPGFLNDKDSVGKLDIANTDEVINIRDSKIPRIDVARVLVDLAETDVNQRLVIARKGAIKLARNK